MEKAVDETNEDLTKQKEILQDFEFKNKKQQIITEVIAVTFFAVLSFVLAFLFLRGESAAGLDGGYYELQVKTLITEGKLYYESPFLSFIIMALFALIANDISFGVYFSASLFLAGMVVSCYFAARLIWNAKVAILTLPFSALSVFMLRTSTDLIKNTLALVFIPLALAYFNKFHTMRHWKSFVLSLVFSGLTISSHLMTSLVLSVSLVGYFVIYSLITIVEERKFDWKKHLFSAAILAASAVVMILFWVISEYAIPVKETYWEYSSNEIPGTDTSYSPSEESFVLPLIEFFKNFSVFKIIIVVLWIIASIVFLAFAKTEKERNSFVVLSSLAFSSMMLGVSIDVSGWLNRMVLDIAPFIILAGAFVSSFIVLGLERGIKWLDEKIAKVKIQKIKPKITVTFIVTGLLILPLIFPYVEEGMKLKPFLTFEEEADLAAMTGQLPDDNCLVYAQHGYEYWVAFFSEYQTQKISYHPGAINEIYELLNTITPTTYYLNYANNPFLPMIPHQETNYQKDDFTLITPLNDSVNAFPLTIRCNTVAGSTIDAINYRLIYYKNQEVAEEGFLTSYTKADSSKEWNHTIVTYYEPGTFIMELIIRHNNAPQPPSIDIIHTIWHTEEPMFRLVYRGDIFGVVEKNPDYNESTPTAFYKNAEPPPGEPPEGQPPRFSLLTFPLKLQIPVLTAYFHYYFVIPLTMIYWTLLIIGSYYGVRITTKTIMKKRAEKEEPGSTKEEEKSNHEQE